MRSTTFLTVLTSVVLAVKRGGSSKLTEVELEIAAIKGDLKSVKLPQLEYKLNELEPYIDQETMEIHYKHHFQNYANKFNVALESLPTKDVKEMGVLNLLMNLNEVKNTEIQTILRNNGGGYINHFLFFNSIAPAQGKKVTKPVGQLNKAIQDSFGDFENFQTIFTQAAVSVFGSGWVWLVVEKKNEKDQGKLAIVTTANQDNPLMFETNNMMVAVPILGLDMWEHAYYLKHTYKKQNYVNDFWHVVNWENVNDLFEMVISKDFQIEQMGKNGGYLSEVSEQLEELEEQEMEQEEQEEQQTGRSKKRGQTRGAARNGMMTAEHFGQRRAKGGFKDLSNPSELFIFS